MYVIYCLKNESLKNNILSFGITSSLEELKKLLKDINKTFIPTPYTIFTIKNVNNSNCIEKLYTLLGKFGKHIKDSFFEIAIEIVKQLFDLIQDNNNNVIINDKYIVVQDKIEYIIPKLDCKEDLYAKSNKLIKKSIESISTMLEDIDNFYDKLKPRQNSEKYNDDGDLDL
jgi:hypothetical protein